jgi:hypothetical protein
MSAQNAETMNECDAETPDVSVVTMITCRPSFASPGQLMPMFPPSQSS